MQDKAQELKSRLEAVSETADRISLYEIVKETGIDYIPVYELREIISSFLNKHPEFDFAVEERKPRRCFYKLLGYGYFKKKQDN